RDRTFVVLFEARVAPISSRPISSRPPWTGSGYPRFAFFSWRSLLMFLSRLARWIKPQSPNHPRRRTPASRPHRFVFRPRLDLLEDRTVPAALDHLSILAPANSVAGGIIPVTVIAQDEANQPVTDYTGTIHFDSSDPQNVLPYDFHFTVADQGTHTFSIILRTAGSQSVQVSDSAAGLNGSAGIQVAAGALDHLSFSTPSNTTAGQSFAMVVNPQDVYGNTITDY